MEAFGKIDELEKVKLDIKQKTTIAVQNIEIGMTESEVIKLIGQPRSRSHQNLNYGNVWLIFDGGVVRLLVDSRCFTVWGWESYFNSLNPCGPGKGMIQEISYPKTDFED